MEPGSRPLPVSEALPKHVSDALSRLFWIGNLPPYLAHIDFVDAIEAVRRFNEKKTLDGGIPDGDLHL